LRLLRALGDTTGSETGLSAIAATFFGARDLGDLGAALDGAGFSGDSLGSFFSCLGADGASGLLAILLVIAWYSNTKTTNADRIKYWIITPLQGCRVGCDLKKSAQAPTQIESDHTDGEGGGGEAGAGVDAFAMMVGPIETEFFGQRAAAEPTILSFHFWQASSRLKTNRFGQGGLSYIHL